MKKAINIIFLLVILISITTSVYALTLSLEVISNKEEVEVGEEIIITVDWKEGMQAADFILKYDNEKFKFISVNIDNELLYKNENSQIEVAWFSMDDTDKTNLNFVFKALKPGKANFSTEIDGGFATGELVLPDNYNTDSTTVKINGFTIENVIPIIIAIILILAIIILIRAKKAKTYKK